MKQHLLLLTVIYQTICLSVYPTSNSNNQLQQCLNANIKNGKRLHFPGEELYDKGLSHWNTYLKTKQLDVITSPLDETEVIKTIECANQFNKTVSIKSGGHSYEGYWMGNDHGILIDLKYMDEVKIDTVKKTVRVGGGTLLGPLMAKLWKKDKGALPHGLQQQIGIGGHTLGGGYGLLSRKYGLLMDRVIEMDVILNNGKKVVANKDQNSDLFFALRGAGGGSFGVVTSFTFSYINPAPTLKVARLKWTAGTNNFTSIFNSIMQYYSSNPDRGATMYVNFGAKGSIIMGATFSCDTTEEQNEAYKAMMNVLEPPTKVDTRNLNFIDSFLFYSGLGGEPDSVTLNDLEMTKPEPYERYFKGKSGYFIKAPPKAVVDKLGELLVNHKRVGFFLLIDLQGGAIRDTADEATSFDHRNTLASAQIAATSEDGVELMNSVYKLLEPYMPQAYQNYIDREEKDWTTKYYGNSIDKLILIKNKYDEKNMFSFERSIPLLK
ncbi:FAD-binding domain-containing protein [Neoconidiobolus thromboides FSU 785]|nr:FAD-binding domain-containing protein [Neoconidiobolus thromboides FSU 785]